MIRLVLLLVSFSAVSAAVNATVEKYVEDAIFEAMGNVNSATSAPSSGTAEKIVSSQIANAGAIELQFTGDILEEATKILVAKYGVDILPAANEVLEAWNAESAAAAATDSPNSSSESDSNSNSADSSEESRSKRDVFRVKRGAGGYTNTASNQTCRGPPKRCNDRVHDRIRSITGYCNNRANPTLGNALTSIRRLIGTVSYTDGLQTIRNLSVTGSPLPSTRYISNKLHDEGVNPHYSPSVNHLHMQIGQFIAHDVIFMPSSVAKDGSDLNCLSCSSPTTVSSNCAPIPVPTDDAYFKQNGTTPRCIRLTRSLNGQTGFGVRTQIDQNTHFLDMSTVYGSSDCEAQSVRSFVNGQLKEYTTLGYTLPPQNFNDSNCQSTNPYYCFTAGDFRNCLHPALLPLHSLFIKEHNRLATLAKQVRPNINDEDLYQFVRRIMVALWQNIVYTEYLPKLLTDKYLTDFKLKTTGQPGIYNNSQNPSLSAEFTAAAFRFGHSQARQNFTRQDVNNNTIGQYDLGNNIFYSDQVYQKQLGGWETMLNGLLRTPGMVADRYYSFPIRNQLFETRGQPGSGVDLVAVNIMRGRDVGLQPYVKYRSAAGLSSVNTWNDLSSTFSSTNLAALKTVYADPADIDLYTGLIMETPLTGSQIGPTASYIIAEQFNRLKTGDRFFYENFVPNTVGFRPEQIQAIRQIKLAKIICDNTGIVSRVPSDIFDFTSTQVACSSLPSIDINLFFL
ncbi:unnamed protein product [Caenorhabditis angaria]|uniref:Uncharacterized protein n=1 Tax=Caenorhabditis angaria TaxID=860376 RepID=A0A9P1IW31_9PELO|nr:unnamed protein product [Caenorhabditis angaria]